MIRRVENPQLVVDPPPYRHNQIFRGPRHLFVDIGGIAIEDAIVRAGRSACELVFWVRG